MILIISVLLALTLLGCTNKKLGEKSPYKIINDKVTIEVKENTLSNISATIILINKKEYNWEYRYVKLTEGTYRLVTDFVNTKEKIYVVAEFIIK